MVLKIRPVPPRLIASLVSKGLKMATWQANVSQRLRNVQSILDAPTLGSNLPNHILQTIALKVSQIDFVHIDPDAIRALVRGAFRALGDSGDLDENDAIVKELSSMYSEIPEEE